MADGLQTIETGSPVVVEVDKAKDEKKQRMRKKLLWMLASTVVFNAAAAGAHWVFVGSHYVSTDNAYVDASSAQIGTQVAGGVLQVPVEETQSVRKGDVLIVIDPADARLALARAEAEYARTLQQVRQYYAQESASEAQVRSREADFDRAEVEYARRRELAKTGAISGEELTSVRTAYDAAKANLSSAREALAAQRALTHGVSERSHPDTLAAKAALEAAKLDLQRTVIRAPIDGVIAQSHVSVGQRVAPGQPLIIVAPLAQAYVDANFKEGQLRKVRVGQPVKLTSDLHGHDVVYHGKVAGLGGGTGSAFAIIPAQNATGNWIKVVQRVPVRISLDPAELKAHPLRVGLSMEAKIDVSKKT